MKTIDANEIQKRGNFAVVLKCLMAKNKVTHSELATAVGISQATVSHYVRGKYTPTQNVLGRIADYLKVSPNIFYEKADDLTPCLNRSLTHFSSTLFNLIKDKGITCKQLAEEIKVSRQTVSYYVNGKQLPTSSVAKRIADYFGVTIDYLINDNDDNDMHSHMKLCVTHVPETPEQCIFCKNQRNTDGSIRFLCSFCNDACRMINGICPYMENKF